MPAASANTNSAPQRGDPRVRELSPADVQKLVDIIKTPRQLELESYQAVFECKQYAGRAHFYNDDVPLQERAPIIQYPLCKLAVESNVAFAMGEGRFPTILSLSSENDDVFDKQLGLDATSSQTLDSFNSKLVDLARLEQSFRQAYRMAQASRSVALVLGFRAGLPFVDLVWAKLCTPTFGDPLDPNKCTRLEIRYRYTDTWRDPFLTSGKTWTRVWEYLRVIDAEADTVYKPTAIWDEADVGTVEGSSAVQARTNHGFGLCPVHWYARNRASLVGTSPDGECIHDGMRGLLEQLDFAVSQRHRAAVYAGDPQTVLTGVSPDDTFGETGRAVSPKMFPGDDKGAAKQWSPSLYGANNASGSKVRRGVGQVWRIADPSGSAALLCLPGDALKGLDDDARDLASKACDGLGVTIVDPTAFGGGGDLSGRTLAFIFSKQINRVSQDREDLARCCILPVLNLFYRMLLSQPQGVYMPGLPKVLPILSKFYVAIADGSKIWFAPQLKLKWGDYFEPSDVDESTRSATAIAAYTAKIITLKSAVEHVRSVFAIGSVDQYVDALTQEADDNAQKAIDQAQAMAAAVPPQPPAAGNPSAQKSPNAAPPASGTPKAKRVAPMKK